jgi:hypothetical protein
LPVDDWRLTEPHGNRLGTTRPVVMRLADAPPYDDFSLHGDHDADLETERRERWHALHSGRPVPVVLDCEDSIALPVPDTAALRVLPRHAVPVLCGRSAAASEVLLSRLLAAGHPVALWRRPGRAQEALCGEFHRNVRDTVMSVATTAELPDTLFTLRARYAAGEADAFWSGGLMLLYDDPTQPLPGAGDMLEAP